MFSVPPNGKCIMTFEKIWETICFFQPLSFTDNINEFFGKCPYLKDQYSTKSKKKEKYYEKNDPLTYDLHLNHVPFELKVGWDSLRAPFCSIFSLCVEQSSLMDLGGCEEFFPCISGSEISLFFKIWTHKSLKFFGK